MMFSSFGMAYTFEARMRKVPCFFLEYVIEMKEKNAKNTHLDRMKPNKYSLCSPLVFSALPTELGKPQGKTILAQMHGTM